MQANPGEALEVARDLMACGGPAALGTLDETGGPFVSHVLTAPDRDGAPILLLSHLAVHSSNLARDPRASLLLVQGGGEGAAARRLSLVGRVVAHPDPAHARAAFLARHPEAAGYAGFADFGFHRFDIHAGHLVAGFGLIERLAGKDLLSLSGGDAG